MAALDTSPIEKLVAVTELQCNANRAPKSKIYMNPYEDEEDLIRRLEELGFRRD